MEIRHYHDQPNTIIRDKTFKEELDLSSLIPGNLEEFESGLSKFLNAITEEKKTLSTGNFE